VSNDDCAGSVADWIAKYFSRVHLSDIHESNRNDPCGYDLMRAVERNSEEVFLGAIGQVLEQWKCVSGASNLNSLRANPAPREFQGCYN